MTSKPNRTISRLKGYDYTRPGAYCVTICAFKRCSIFGRVFDGRMELNRLGGLTACFWQAIPRHFATVELDAFVVMPNHLHGIVVIRDPSRDTACRVPTSQRGEGFARPVTASLSTIIRSFKAAVRREAARRLRAAQPVWQPRYYEHIIRDEEDLDRAREYIASNARTWDADRENPAASRRPLRPDP